MGKAARNRRIRAEAAVLTGRETFANPAAGKFHSRVPGPPAVRSTNSVARAIRKSKWRGPRLEGATE